MTSPLHHKAELQRIARRALEGHGLFADFDQAALSQLATIPGPAQASSNDVRDLRGLPWCSIDNEESKDLDQLTVAQEVADGAVRLFVAIADVDALVPSGSPIDTHAAKNTASIYAAGHVFPMLPERLSTDLTSLGPSVDRICLIVEFVVRKDGNPAESEVSRGLVRNYAKLTYKGVGAWLDGQGPLPEAAASVPGMDAQLRLQDSMAGRLRQARHEKGALEFASQQWRPVYQGDAVVGLSMDKPNRAKWLIEEFMIAGNGVVARFLEAKGRPSLRRVVRSPERWAKMVEVAARYGETLPGQPSSRALESFLAKRRIADPLRFPDLSLVIIKLMGPGEYVAELPGADHAGHFGLSVRDYSHATAPNRRFSDLVTQRLLKAALTETPSPFGISALAEIAKHCTFQEGNIAKVERQVHKSAAVLLLEQRVGESFDGVITGAAEKGTWVRIFDPPAEGRVVEGGHRLRVGDKARVVLVDTDFERGYLDFALTR
jgi:exoribonuclease II